MLSCTRQRAIKTDIYRDVNNYLFHTKAELICLHTKSVFRTVKRVLLLPLLLSNKRIFNSTLKR